MNPQKYAITFACYNQVEYTKQCINSMHHGLDLSRLVIVDNTSSDGTRDYLACLPFGRFNFKPKQFRLWCGVEPRHLGFTSRMDYRHEQ